MSVLLDSLLSATQRRDCAVNETPTQPMRLYMVRIKRGQKVITEFEAMGYHSCAVAAQAQCLCDSSRGEYVTVEPLDADRIETADWPLPLGSTLEGAFKRPEGLTAAMEARE